MVASGTKEVQTTNSTEDPLCVPSIQGEDPRMAMDAFLTYMHKLSMTPLEQHPSIQKLFAGLQKIHDLCSKSTQDLHASLNC